MPPGEPAALAFLHTVEALPTGAQSDAPMEDASPPAAPGPATPTDCALPHSAIETALNYRFRHPELLKVRLRAPH